MAPTRRKKRRIQLWVSEETYQKWRRIVEENMCGRELEACLKKLIEAYEACRWRGAFVI